MNATPFVAAAAIAAALFTVAANAQTGRPSADEIGPPAAPTSVVDTAAADVGSYARYEMLNGKTRDEAIADARGVDHKHYPRFVFHGKPAKGDVPATRTN
jgi:hypothetical protein